MQKPTRQHTTRSTHATSDDLAHAVERPPPIDDGSPRTSGAPGATRRRGERPVTLTLYVDSSNARCHGVEARLRSFLRQSSYDGIRVRVLDIATRAPFRDDGDITVTPCIVLRGAQEHKQVILGNLQDRYALSLAIADSGVRPLRDRQSTDAVNREPYSQ